LKLVQLNIWQGRLLPQVLRFLKKEQPDLICLQEVYSSSFDTPLFDFLGGFEAIQSILPGHHGFFSAVYDMAILGEQVRFGNALFSRYPIISEEATLTSGESHSYKTFNGYVPNTRNLQRVMLAVDGHSLCLINHHGYWDSTPFGNEQTAEKMRIVSEIVSKSPRPLIFAGDLNIVPESLAMRPLQAQLRDLTQEYKLATTLSSLGKVKNVACDHIMVSSGIHVRQFTTSKTLVSDHKALLLEFDL